MRVNVELSGAQLEDLFHENEDLFMKLALKRIQRVAECCDAEDGDDYTYLGHVVVNSEGGVTAETRNEKWFYDNPEAFIEDMEWYE